MTTREENGQDASPHHGGLFRWRLARAAPRSTHTVPSTHAGLRVSEQRLPQRLLQRRSRVRRLTRLRGAGCGSKA